jgi:molybdopterin molybdotransferase
MDQRKADWLELEDALALIMSKVHLLTQTEEIPIVRALGRLAAAPVYAPLDNPPFDRSPLDGFALNSESTRNASAENPAKLRVTGSITAGTVLNRQIKPVEALQIMTGAMIPEGCDCIVRQEAVQTEGEDVLISTPLASHENYVFRGEDIQKGKLLLSPGERLSSIHLTLLAIMGMEKVTVRRNINIGILCTGDELTPLGKALEPGKIYNSNGILLSGRLREFGFSPLLLPDSPDDPEEVAQKIESVIDSLDLFISTGGVSVGEKDIFHKVFELLGAERLFWRITVKPSSVTLCGLFRDKLLMGLSGNPFACLCSFELLVRPVLAKLSGCPGLEGKKISGILKADYKGRADSGRRFIRALLEDGMITLPKGHSSGQLLSLLGCNCLVDIPAGVDFMPAGTAVKAITI